jgi:hypothetical protein
VTFISYDVGYVKMPPASGIVTGAFDPNEYVAIIVITSPLASEKYDERGI